MLAANRLGIMHLATVSGFTAALPKTQRAGSELLGGHSRNGRMQNCAVHRGAPSPSLGTRFAKLEICLIFESAAVVSAVVGVT